MIGSIIEAFETNQCHVIVVKLPYQYAEQDIYAVISIHKCDGKINTRFGNKLQMENMVSSYVRTGTQYTE